MMMIRISRTVLSHRYDHLFQRLSVKFYSDDKRYRSIEDFNKSKTDYTFNHQANHHSPNNSNTNDLHAKVLESLEEEQAIDINEVLENDPRLRHIDKNSPDYKNVLEYISKEYKAKQKANAKSYQRTEKFKAIGLGLTLCVSLIITHQVFFNWKWYKTRFFKSWYQIDEDKVKQPSNHNQQKYRNLKLQEIVNSEFVNGLLKSDENPGLYVFGYLNGKKLPTRIPFFDGMILKDVKINNNLLVVIDDKGKMYQYSKQMQRPELVQLPFKVDKCVISQESIYLLTTSGQLALTPRLDMPGMTKSEPSTKRNWLGLPTLNNYHTIKFINHDTNLLQQREKVRDIETGYNHLLILTTNGRIFTMKTSESGDNFGQFGLPQFAPVQNPTITTNVPFELTLLNNQVFINKQQKSLKPRIITSIAAGDYHNIVSDSEGNIWTWGMNSYGQCGLNVSYQTNIQAVPVKILGKEDYAMICHKQIPKFDQQNVSVSNVYANAATSFIKLNYKNGETTDNILLSFGNGTKGQLGINRFLHVSHRPLIIKSIMLQEFNEQKNQIESIGIADFSAGNNHSFVKLNNQGDYKDVLVFGDNEYGQFGNSKLVKNAKPTSIPKLLEPLDFNIGEVTKDSINNITKKIHDVDNRLQLHDNLKLKRSVVEQVIEATDDSSVVYYKRK